jgi:FdhE protein
LSPLTRDTWLAAHPYLKPVAAFCAQVDRAAEDLTEPARSLPDWSDYDAEFREGVPLLQSLNADLDPGPAGKALVALVAALSSAPLEGKLAAETSALHADLQGETNPGRRAVDWLLGDPDFTPSSPGLMRYLGWSVLARYLRPVVDAFAAHRDDTRWLRRYCPTCGSPPAMAQLVGSDPGRKRLLACGRCDTRWQYSRTACPFCDIDSQRLASLTIEGEAGLRLDYCGSCRGYLKTYDGEGHEALLLSDWTSLHLDLAALDRGLHRLASSLFELPTSHSE